MDWARPFTACWLAIAVILFGANYGGLFAVALVSGALGGGCFLYRKKKLAVDQLALVTAMEVGLPGAQPYQVDAVVEKNPQNIETSSNESPKPEDTNTENMDSNNEMDGQAKQQNSEEASEQHRKGKKGFKFGRLKEEPVNFCNGSPGLKGMAVVIGNPAYQEESKQAQEEDKIKEKVQEQSLNVDPSVEDSQFIVGNGKVNGMYSEGDTPDSSLEDNISINKHQKVPEEEELSINGHPLETEDSLDGSGQVGQGARRKVRGMSSAITGSTTMVSAEVGNTSDSQKCL
ncbi:hypothetical protein Hamer_G007792 [Homarus americanus]|uniref:Uncharacterized protein n=1 Tax=Homarus americanus TaxID=6706 RepID=A0A8J5MR94_HOMAM|nr:hypothetical protein Hamer_G007792 [Homarus americanus]